MANRCFSFHAVLPSLLFAFQVCGGAENSSSNITATSTRTLDFRSLPSDAFTHLRTKWSGDLFILIDDDAAAPSFYMFDRSGQVKFDAVIQISGANRVRVDDFAAAPDGSVWTCGHAESPAGQRSFFLAHLTDDAQRVQIIRTNPYRPWYLAVAPDGTVWTMGYALGTDGRVDLTLDSLRHFDTSGKLIASAIPAQSVGILSVELGYLEFYRGRLGWYSPSSGSRADRSVPDGAYVEISPTNMTVLHSYPAVPRKWNDYAIGFALTPGGRVFVKMQHPSGGAHPSDLYELDRSGSRWVLSDGLRNQQGYILRLQGNDGESLVFGDLFDKSKLPLQILDASQFVRHQ